MSDNEVAIIVLSIIFGSIVAIVAISKLFGVIKAWIERNNSTYDEETFDRLAKVFIQHKKDSERRLQNIEAIITSDESKSPSVSSSSGRQLKEPTHKSIEINDPESRSGQAQKESGNLQNMLNKKRTE